MGQSTRAHERTAASAARLETEAGIRAATVFDRGRNPTLQFARWERGHATYSASIRGGRTSSFVPHPALGALAQRGAVLLPSAVGETSAEDDLRRDVAGFIRRYAFVPESVASIFVAYVLLSWVYDRFDALPYVHLIGEPGSGKTRTLRVLAHLSFNGTALAGSVSGAVLFRLQEMVQGALFLDEADFRSSSEYDDLIKILNCGYQAGLPVVRCSPDGFVPEAFHCFGPKVIATRHPFQDPATESRCLTFTMPGEALPAHIPRQLPGGFFSESQALRNRLLRWRFERRDSIRPDEALCRQLEPRAAQIALPLLSVANDSSFQHDLVAWLEQQTREARADSDAGRVARALCEGWPEGGSILPGEVARRLEANDGDVRLAARRVGSLVRSLGLPAGPRVSQGRTFALTREKIEDMRTRFGL